jgi:hypothetical protein
MAQSFAPSLTNSAYATASFTSLNVFESTEINGGTSISAKDQGKPNAPVETDTDSQSAVGRKFENIKVYTYVLIAGTFQRHY